MTVTNRYMTCVMHLPDELSFKLYELLMKAKDLNELAKSTLSDVEYNDFELALRELPICVLGLPTEPDNRVATPAKSIERSYALSLAHKHKRDEKSQ